MTQIIASKAILPDLALFQTLKEACNQSAATAKIAYEKLIPADPCSAESRATRSLSAALDSRCKPYNAARFEVLENRLREKIGLPVVWHQKANTEALEAFESAGISRKILPALFVGQLVKHNLIPLMGASISNFFRERDGKLEGQFVDPRARLWKQIPQHWKASVWRITAAGITLWHDERQSPLTSAYPLQPEAPLPDSLRQSAHQAEYVGIWSLDTPQATTRFGHLHHGIAFLSKEAGAVSPTLDFGGFGPSTKEGPAFDVVDSAYTSLIDGRRTASGQLFRIGSLDSLHRLYALLQQQQPEGCESGLEFLWQEERHRRFPALIHALITRSEPKARSLMDALERAAAALELPAVSPLSAQSVLSLAIELSEKAYPSFDGKKVNCRFLAKRVMRVASALLDLQPASHELSGLSGSIGPIHLRETPRRAWICRLMLWLADLLGWWADRFGRTLALPAELAWKSEFPKRLSPAVPDGFTDAEPTAGGPSRSSAAVCPACSKGCGSSSGCSPMN